MGTTLLEVLYWSNLLVYFPVNQDLQIHVKQKKTIQKQLLDTQCQNNSDKRKRKPFTCYIYWQTHIKNDRNPWKN